jgi:poly(A) polymerase
MASLKPVENITNQEWLNTPSVRLVMDTLNNAKAPQALFVGGCVRNALLGEAVEDIDIATRHAPEHVSAVLEKAGFKVIPTGIEHGTVTAVMDKQAFEITTLRKDVETDGRHATVAFTDDWVEDAQRRDFTMNTLLADIGGAVYDPLGQGVADLKARRVVFVGEAEQRITEDHLRILRFFRFHAIYGRGDADTVALKACEAAADQVTNLSKERITQEVFKIMSGETPQRTLALMFEHKVLTSFDFEGYEPAVLAHLCTFQNRYGLAFIAARLLALCGFEKRNIEALEKFLLLPKVFKKDMQAITGILTLPDMSDDHAVKTAIYKYGRLAAAQSLMIELAQDRVMNGYAPKALDLIQNWDIPNFPISGNDLIKKGHKPGPELGARLEALEEEWIKGGFKG